MIKDDNDDFDYEHKYDYNRQEESKPARIKKRRLESCKEYASMCRVTLQEFIDKSLFVMCKYLNGKESEISHTDEGRLMSVKDMSNYMHDLFEKLGNV